MMNQVDGWMDGWMGRRWHVRFRGALHRGVGAADRPGRPEVVLHSASPRVNC